MSARKRIAITTGGGDAPGLNAVLHAATLAALQRGWEIVGIRDGFDGILRPERHPAGGLVALDRAAVETIVAAGGTILGTTNRGDPRRWPVPNADGTVGEVDRTAELADRIRGEGFDVLVAVGGDGTLAIAAALHRHGLPCVGVPKTIDNDLDGTVVTFGFDTAVSFATECLDRLHTTAASHRRVMVVEVMGRYAGWIALDAGLAGGADVILVPEIPYDLRSVRAAIDACEARRKRHATIVVAEGARPRGGATSVVGPREAGAAERLGGAGERVAAEIASLTRRETRVVVLGHLLRGGSPTSFDRRLALKFGAAAVRAIAAERYGVMVALDPPNVKHVPLEDATRRMKSVPLDCDAMVTARELGICLGD